jgi:hypothetical protein
LRSAKEDIAAESTEVAKLNGILQKANTESELLNKINEELKLRCEQIFLQLQNSKDTESLLTQKQLDIESAQREVLSLKKRNADLEKDRRELKNTLDNTMTDLEKKAAYTLDNATHRLTEKDDQIRLLTDRLSSTEQTLSQLRLQNQEIVQKSQQVDEAAGKQIENLSNELKTKLTEVQQLRVAFSSELQQVQTRYEDQLQEERRARKINEARLREESAKVLKEQISILEANHKEEIDSVRIMAEDRIKSSEAFMKVQIDDEIDGGIKSLKLRHAVEVSDMQEKFQLRLEDLTRKEQAKAETAIKNALRLAEDVYSRNLADLESKHGNEISKLRLEFSLAKEKVTSQLAEEFSEALRVQREEQATEKNSELHALLVQHREQTEDLQKSFAQEKESLLASLQRENDRKTAEHLEEKMLKFEGECESRILEAVKETKAKYQTQLKSALSAHKVKLEEKLKERFQLVADEEQRLQKKEMDLEAAWWDKLNEVEKSKQTQLSELQMSHKNTLDEVIRSTKAERDEHWTKLMEREHRDLLYEHTRQLRTTEEQLETKHRVALQQLEKELRDLHGQELRRELSEAESISREQDVNHKEELALLQQRFQNELSVMMRDCKEAARKEHCDALDLATKYAEDRLSTSLGDQEAKLRKEFELQYLKHEASSGLILEDAKLQAQRQSEADVARVNQEWKEKLRNSIETCHQQSRLELQSSLEAQKVKLEDRYKSLLSERDDMIAKLHGEVKALLHSSSEDLTKSLLEQQATAAERHRQEATRQRDAVVALEAKYEKVISEMTDQHEQALNTQRKQLEQAFKCTLDVCNAEIATWEMKYGDFVTQTAISRQQEEVALVERQRQQFDALLEASLTERDEHHRLSIERQQAAYESEKNRVTSQYERQLASLNADHVTETETLRATLVSSQQQWKSHMQHESDLRLARHRDEMAQLAAELNAQHAKNTAEVKAAERAACDAKIQVIMSEIASASAIQNDSALVLARQRADFERQKLELTTREQAALAIMQNDHQTRIRELEDCHRSEKAADAEKTRRHLELQAESLRTEFAVTLAACEREFEERSKLVVEAMESKHRLQLQHKEDVLSRAIEEKHCMQEASAKENSSLQNSFQQQISSLRLQLTLNHEEELRDLADRLERIHASKIAEIRVAEKDAFAAQVVSVKREMEQLSRDHKLELLNVRNQHDRDIKEIQEKQRLSTESLNRRHTYDLLELESKTSADKHAFVSALQLENISKSESEKILRHRELTECLQRQEQEFTEKWHKVLHDSRLKNDEVLEEVNRRHDAKVLALRSEHDRTVEEYEARIKTMEIAESLLSKSFSEKLEEMNSQTAAERSRVMETEMSLRCELTALNQRHQSDVDEMTTKHQATVEDLHERHRQDMGALHSSIRLYTEECNSLKSEIETCKGLHAAALENISNTHIEEFSKWNLEMDEMAKEIVRMEHECQRMQEAERQVPERLHLLEADFKDQLLSTRNQYEVAIADISEQNGLLAVQTQNLLNEKTRWEDKCSALEEDLKGALEEAQGHSILALEFSAQLTELRITATGHEHQLQQSAVSHMESVAAVESELASARNRINELLNEADQLREDFSQTLRTALLAKEEEIRGKYFDLFQQQMTYLQQVIESQGRSQQKSLPHLAGTAKFFTSSTLSTLSSTELHHKFLTLVEDLPAFLRDSMAEQSRNPSLPTVNMVTTPSDDSTGMDVTTSVSVGTATTRVVAPISVLTQAEGRPKTSTVTDKGGYLGVAAEAKMVGDSATKTFMSRSLSLGRPASQSSASSPADQLIACINDGDVQGVRTVVRSVSGDDLRSDYWKSVCRTLMPLHRALTGLHFHGSEKRLYQVLEALILLGASVYTTDRHGNTVLHKAVAVCSSKSVVSVVKLLLQKGADVRARNKDGDMAVHLECKW